ncbi:MAG TPA: M48 family metallopeptidase, partial [Armatimonadota bacterium]|nr:M48 family metallopeptidase [Armatimonadota bacterium]
ADLERQYGVVNDPTATARVANIGRAIAAVSARPALPWSFKILNISEVNALALPGGYIYVTRGLLEQGVSNAELAGVMGHEIAHVNQRHSVDAIERAMTYDLLSDLVLGRSSRGVQVAADLAIQYAVQLPHSRQDEYEADDIGMRLAYNAGYPPNGMVQFLTRLQQLSGPTRTPEWMRTHPLTEDRITRAQQIATSLQGQRRPVPVSYHTGDGEGGAGEAT